MKKLKISLLIIIFSITKLYSQDIRSAYMQLTWISGYTYSITVFLFTDASININRPTVWVDIAGESLDTYSLNTITAINGINIKKYSGSHTFFGQGIYNLTFQDSLRVTGIKNIQNSQTHKIQLTSYFTISSFSVTNSNPTLQNFPIYFGVNGNLAFFNPNFIDTDGDSLSYIGLDPCYTNPTSDYYIPNGATLNNQGIVSFSKDSLGLYSFSYQIKEWRKDLNNNYYSVAWSRIDFAMDISSSIGLNELNSSKQITLYPNPVSSTLFISSGQYFGAGTEIEITNCLGQSVIKLPYRSEIDVSSLSNGYYFIKLRTKDMEFNSKFIKE